ncbi:LytR/AlgR family response regulator transcription factor [Bacillus niameyensis]|uniref:LytR/AlgR family response regulator transcription factor n=1 Tax=Bacillus niameyensis TaxID=1522308 RepID=UPI0007807799|nr:LytTR family DNA-binding domain-containing protein [Bacillus niameyensis]
MKKAIRSLLVDDELYSRDELKHLLQVHPSIQIIGEADAGDTALMKCMKLEPDVVFLDVEMPRMNGMEVAQALQSLKSIPEIVFATAYSQFAAEAFRYNALDYLLKPYDEEQLAETVKRIEEKFTAPVEHQKPTGKLAVESDGEISYLEPAEILYLSRDERLTKIVTKTKEFETKTSLKDLESRLHSFHFFRIHKSYLVNLDYVLRLTPWFNGAYQLQISGVEESLPVSRNYVKSLRARLEL